MLGLYNLGGEALFLAPSVSHASCDEGNCFLIMNSDEVMSVELTLEYYKSAVHKMFTPEKPVKLYTTAGKLCTIKPGAYRYHSVLLITDCATVTD